MEDDIFKIIAFSNESNRYAKALFNEKYNDLDIASKGKIDALVSEIVKNTYPTFSRVPAGVKNLSRFLFLGNFLSFNAESVRVSYQTLKLANEEINSGNEALRRIGMTRMAGTIAYNSILSSIAVTGGLLLGAGFSGMAGYFGDTDEQKRKDHNRRLYMASWNKDKDVYVKQYSNGKLIYVDMGSADPYGYQKEVWNTFWNHYNDGEGFTKAMALSMGKAVQPLMELDMTMKTFTQLYNNENDYGKQIVLSSDKPMVKTQKVMQYLNKSVAPGVVTTGIKMVDSYNSDKDKFKAEVGSLTGYRVYTVDLAQQFSIALNSKATSIINPAGAFKDRINNDYGKNWYTIKNSDMSPADKDKEYHRLANGIRDVLKEVRGYYEGAIEGGVPENQLKEILIKSRLFKGNIQSVLENRFDYPDQYYLRK
jgi:hypothetical protein